jgi:hypothetical protein
LAVTEILTIRLFSKKGEAVEHEWSPDACYLVCDTYPHLDIKTRGHRVQAQRPDVKLPVLEDPSEDGTQWQRWSFEADLARLRRMGEMTLSLTRPVAAVLRCYVIPTALLSYREVVAMVDDIEAELATSAAWNVLSDSPDRSWSRPGGALPTRSPAELIRLVEDEERAAVWIRRDPFTEPGPASRHGAALPENALVSHWAARRSGQLLDMLESVNTTLDQVRAQASRNNPERRQEKLEQELAILDATADRLIELRSATARMVRDIELGTTVYPGPLFQRDHRLRLLLRVFAPPSAESLSEVESSRSHYPPVFLNHLWELWGAVWLVKSLRSFGFTGFSAVDGSDALESCSWRMTNGDITIDLDYEPHAVLVDYGAMPPMHEREEPALEWAARNQELDPSRPFIGLDVHCSPDYVVRITTTGKYSLLVGDGCLASPQHHGKKPDRSDSKPFVVERYRRSIGWLADSGVVRCHPLGGFTIFPAPSQAWSYLEALPGAADCTLLCPGPLDDTIALGRLKALLRTIEPRIRFGPELLEAEA